MSKISEYLKKVDDVIAKGVFKDDWASLAQFKTPSWYRKGRFGLFIHFGAYSVPAYFNEWYPRLMYKKLHPSNAHKCKTYGEAGEYRQIAQKFNPDKFNADEWLALFKESGAKYIMPVGEHHDGIKMYKSDLNQWNLVDMIGLDYLGELRKSCQKYGLGFLTSSHRAEHFWFFNTARKNYPNGEVASGKYEDLYGPAFVPESGNIDRTDKEIFATKEWLEDWLASTCEMIDNNRPLAIYFDWWVHKDEFRPYMKKFLAYYYNRGLEWGEEVAVFYKWGAIMHGCAIFDVERGQIDGVSLDLWQNDTAIAKNSWGYTEGNRFKTVGEIVRNMIDVVSKNGCYMLNVGPKADGTVCPEEKAVLKGIGKWLGVNGEAIYDSFPFEGGFGEGKMSSNGAFKESKKYCKKDYRFSYKTGEIFVFPMGEKESCEFKVSSLRFSNEKGIRYHIKDVVMLGGGAKVSYTQDEKFLTIKTDKAVGGSLPVCFKVLVD